MYRSGIALLIALIATVSTLSIAPASMDVMSQSGEKNLVQRQDNSLTKRRTPGKTLEGAITNDASGIAGNILHNLFGPSSIDIERVRGYRRSKK
jgi:hypothetical protein